MAMVTPERGPVLHEHFAGPTVCVAAFRSGGTRRLSRELGRDVAVLATVKEPGSHALRLSRRRHAALSTRPDWYLPWDSYDAMEPESSTFQVFAMDPRWLGQIPLPRGLAIVGGVVRVSLPPGSTVAAFEAPFRAAMVDREFERVARRPDQVRFRYRTGRPLEIRARYSASANWFAPEVVDDIYVFRPRSLPDLVGRIARARAILDVRHALGSLGRGIARDA